MKQRAILGLALGAAFLAAAGSAQAADKFTIQLKWVTQAQFAGYYVAKDKGFYKDVNLDVTVKPGGPDIAPPQVMAAGGADAIIDWMPSALASREKGVPLVNVSQTFQKSGMMLTCSKASGVTSPDKFPGQTLGVWFYGNEYPFLTWMAKLGIPTDGSPKGVKVLKQGFNVDPIIQKQAACISTMTYNEYWQVIDAGFKPDDLVVFKYSEQGVGTMEDGIYANGAKLGDAAYADRLARFVAASNRGWDWAVKNSDAAAKIVLDNDTTGAQTEKHQKRMMGEIAKLVEGSKVGTGYLDPADFDRTVNILLSVKSDPVITKKPEGAWTHAIYEASKKYAK
ncbi:MAG: ABC transporter substrate-binding protein [Ferrovibrio sp.]|jgi:NitT/TauT family transport system substrate-binding protein